MKLPEHLTVQWLREQYQLGAVSPEEVFTQILERVKDHNRYNIWIEPPVPERVIPYIEALGEPDYNNKPLWGIPFAVKDNIDLAGYPTTAACPDYAYSPTDSATVVSRLIAAGAIPLGKTNLDQFATGLVGTRSPYGEVHNALHEELISGGSSAGSAVSVALGEAVFALGTDTAGSGRVPASLNGLVGWKPTVGAWPSKGVVPACASLDCVTVFANNTADAALVDSIARGLDEQDPWSKKVDRAENALPETIIIPQTAVNFYGPYENLYREAWEKAVNKLKNSNILKEARVSVQAADTDFYQKAALLLYGGPCVAERWADLGGFVSSRPESVFPVTRTILESGDRPDYTAEALFRTLHELKEYKRRSENLLKNGVLVFPTCAGTYTRDTVRSNPIDTNSDMGRYTNHCNLLDMCAIAVPMGIMDGDLPFGVTLFAAAENEHLLMGLAETLAEENND
ncbi:MAG: allophanate hydrolase [Lachnospiraceae bacterium]